MRIVFTMPIATALRLVNAQCKANDYENTANEGETEADFARRMIVAQMVGLIATVEGQTAGDAALLAARQAAYQDVTITPTEEP